MASDEVRNGTMFHLKLIGAFYVIVGSVYVIFSILHFVATAVNISDLLSYLNVPSDPIIGAVMLIASILLILAAYRTFSIKEDARAYAIVGWFIGVLVSFVNLLVMLSNAARSTIIGVENLADWTIYDDIVPGLYLGILILLLTPVIIMHGKHSDRITDGKGVK